MKPLLPLILAASCLKWSGGLATDADSEGKRYVLPQAAGLPMEQLARVVAVAGPKNSRATFNGLFDANGREIRVRKWPVLSVHGKQLVLTPAKYAISVSCAQGVESPTSVGISIELAAGRTYDVWCEPVPWSAPVIRFRDESHAEWDARKASPPPQE